MNPHTEDQDASYNSSAYHPFPEPQTIPAGWDLSALMSEPEVDFMKDEDDATEC
jgi:hypothetical protein